MRWGQSSLKEKKKYPEPLISIKLCDTKSTILIHKSAQLNVWLQI